MKGYFGLVLYGAFVSAMVLVLSAALVTRPDAKAAPAPPKPVVASAGLSRFPVLDSRQEIRTGISIVCKAYANRPAFDVSAPVTDSALGFRVVSDCRTVKS